MTALNKQALREAAVRAGGVKWQYMRATQHSKAYITDDKGSPIVNCTDGDVPAKCAGFLESANPATVLALLDELEAAEKRIAELELKLEAADKLQDSAFRHGLQHGFSYGQTDNQAGFEQAIQAYGQQWKGE
ncbi:ead/Ea22-like family protein [Enterobacter hormaechei]|uniref:ead/Ea22-like family protein n=1 Tax=Enterobacter hormaechei TaxID=158836 RepID=UPI0018E6DAFD|nr:ead/Ea22-like family protein [Enterobacter hormaechei]MBI8974053.1 ead/Ea22-like family protein [Enterobacter hormaechei]MBI9029979.1 ead/Ea22-like family protein [Enterobacter hormaechei]